MGAADYIRDAIAAGIPQSAISNFLSGNPGDEHRIMSALGPDYLGGSGGSAKISVSPARIPTGPIPPFVLPPSMEHEWDYRTAYAPALSEPNPYASTNQPGGIFSSSAADATLAGHGGLADNISRPQITIHDASGAPAASMSVMPAGIPPWIWLAAAALVILLVLRK